VFNVVNKTHPARFNLFFITDEKPTVVYGSLLGGIVAGQTKLCTSRVSRQVELGVCIHAEHSPYQRLTSIITKIMDAILKVLREPCRHQPEHYFAE